uniref:Putative secreted protein n=1 Tax=Anopheles darlingi TaxID=43151 RepID=A0A2M4DAZ0_ANODA
MIPKTIRYRWLRQPQHCCLLTSAAAAAVADDGGGSGDGDDASAAGADAAVVLLQKNLWRRGWSLVAIRASRPPDLRAAATRPGRARRTRYPGFHGAGTRSCSSSADCAHSSHLPPKACSSDWSVRADRLW